MRIIRGGLFHSRKTNKRRRISDSDLPTSAKASGKIKRVGFGKTRPTAARQDGIVLAPVQEEFCGRSVLRRSRPLGVLFHSRKTEADFQEGRYDRGFLVRRSVLRRRLSLIIEKNRRQKVYPKVASPPLQRPQYNISTGYGSSRPGKSAREKYSKLTVSGSRSFSHRTHNSQRNINTTYSTLSPLG